TDNGSALSTMTATSSPVCADTAGTGQTNNQPCSSAVLAPGGTSSAALNLSALGARKITLADSAPAAGNARTWSGRFVTPGASRCTGTSAAGCISAGLSRGVGTSHAGGLASLNGGDKVLSATGADVTASFTGGASLVTVSSYADSATAESGVSPGAATSTRTASLSYWSGAGFTTVAVAAATSSTYTVPQVTANYGGTQLVVAGTVKVTPTTTSTTGPAGCSTGPCTTKTTSGSIVADLTYTVYSSGSVIGQFSVSLDLGSALAQTTYKAAPLA
ncbi:MAG: hypothetical protein QOJ92_2075, partial [Frankiales bacterium]|nr:hypothetical protein [Frankiales bacterium]